MDDQRAIPADAAGLAGGERRQPVALPELSAPCPLRFLACHLTAEVVSKLWTLNLAREHRVRAAEAYRSGGRWTEYVAACDACDEKSADYELALRALTKSMSECCNS